jgi:hypothetical protein
MATAQFYIVYIDPIAGTAASSVEEQMNLSVDWYRIKDNIWVLYTTSDEDKWYSRLSPLVKDSGRLFICKLDTTKRQGWMNKDFWKWLRREKET